MHPLQILEEYWKFSNFRPLQEEIINSVLENNDTFALLPTGGGKSICFQIPALIKDGICLVVSPLIALMKDQVAQLKAKGIKALALTSGISQTNLDIQLDNCIYGQYKFLYLSPERLEQHLVKVRLQQMKVNLIVVDEAHCISQWGNDFRPAYKNISALRNMHPQINCIALTATAKKRVIDDIVSNLNLINPNIFKASFKRPNMSYEVIKTEDKWFQLSNILKQSNGVAIIYTRTRRAAIEVNAYLVKKGFSSTFFHGGLSNEEKTKRLQLWLNNQTQIMVATTAFGMGIDKANVKTVIHFNLPDSLENYYQEAGRAGRNGDDALAIILEEKWDEKQLIKQFLEQLPSGDFIKKVYNKLNNFFQISYGEGQLTTHGLNFKLFCNTYQFNKLKTYNALLFLDKNGIISMLQQFRLLTEIKFLIPGKAVLDYLEKNKALSSLVLSILRTYGGIFDFTTKIDLEKIAQKINCTAFEIDSQLKKLEKEQIISLKIGDTDTEITFLKPREDDITINPILKHLEQQYQIKKTQIKAVINYVNNHSVCRSKQLLEYFEESNTENCGVCSVCKAKKPNILDTKTIENNLLSALSKSNLTSRQLLEYADYNEKKLISVIKKLIETQKIKITSNNTYTLIADD